MTTAEPQTFNRYAYCSNDPVNHIDPLGLALSDIGVVQTGDPEYAFTLTGNSDAAFKNQVNQQFADSHGVILTNLTDANGNSNYGTRSKVASRGLAAAFAQIYASATPAAFSSSGNSGAAEGDVTVSPSINETNTKGNPFLNASGELISGQIIWNNHPGQQKPEPLVHPLKDGNGKPLYDNQCAARLSLAFQRSGIDMSSFQGKKVQGLAIRAEDLAKWLTKVLGPPMLLSPATARQQIQNMNGIVYIPRYWGVDNPDRMFNHIDVWGCVAMAWGRNAAFSKSTQSIQFWRLP